MRGGKGGTKFTAGIAEHGDTFPLTIQRHGLDTYRIFSAVTGDFLRWPGSANRADAEAELRRILSIKYEAT